MKELKSATYAEKKTFFPFGKGQIKGFLNEEIVKNWNQPGAPEGAKPITGYKYSGTDVDGGTILPCEDVSSYPEVTNAIIRSQYSVSDELAIQRHHGNDPEEYAEEWEAYNDFCEQSKALAKQWLGIAE